MYIDWLYRLMYVGLWGLSPTGLCLHPGHEDKDDDRSVLFHWIMQYKQFHPPASQHVALTLTTAIASHPTLARLDAADSRAAWFNFTGEWVAVICPSQVSNKRWETNSQVQQGTGDIHQTQTQTPTARDKNTGGWGSGSSSPIGVNGFFHGVLNWDEFINAPVLATGEWQRKMLSLA